MKFNLSKLLYPSGLKPIDVGHSDRCFDRSNARKRKRPCICTSERRKQKQLEKQFNRLINGPEWKGSIIDSDPMNGVVTMHHPSGAIAKFKNVWEQTS